MRARRRLIATEPADALVAYRDLADYDRIFATDEEAAARSFTIAHNVWSQSCPKISCTV